MRFAAPNLAPPFAANILSALMCSTSIVRVPASPSSLMATSNATRAHRDSIRTRFLNRRGIRVIRFCNRDVCSNLEGVKEMIALALIPPPFRGRKKSGELIPASQTSLRLSASLVHEDASCRPSVVRDLGRGA